MAQAIQKWGDQSVTFVLGGDTDPGGVALTRSDGKTASAPALAIVPKLTALENNNVVPGSAVTVDGVSLGSAIGTATVAGQGVAPQLWSRTKVLVPIPATLAPGSYPLALKVASGAASNPLTVTVVAAPASAPGAARPGSSQGPGQPTTQGLPSDPLAPSFNVNHEFVKPPKPGGPVDLTLSADPHSIGPGRVADLVVTLLLNGQPVAGAEVSLSMIYAPAADYSFTPARGVTDANGTFHSSVRISSRAGDNVILAQSGIFSDQDRVIGLGPKNANLDAQQQTGRFPLVTASITTGALVLVIAGFALRGWASPRRWGRL